jgi:hypothetical protein
MNLLPEKIRALAVNAARHYGAPSHRQGEDQSEPDPVPLLKLFNPAARRHGWPVNWPRMAILCSGWPILASDARNWAISPAEIAAVRLPFGLRIERDETFASRHPLSLWAQTARHLGSITQAEIALHLIGF